MVSTVSSLHHLSILCVHAPLKLGSQALGALSDVDVGVDVAPEDVIAVAPVDGVVIDVARVGVVPVEGVGVCL